MNAFTRWFAFLGIVVMIGSFLFGLSAGNADWINPIIAEARAYTEKMNTDVSVEIAEYELEKKQAYDALALEKEQNEMELNYRAELQALDIQAMYHQALALGLVLLSTAAGIGLMVLLRFVGSALYRRITVSILTQDKTSVGKNVEIMNGIGHQIDFGKSLKGERDVRQNIKTKVIYRYTPPFYSNDHTNGLDDLPRVG